MTPKTKQVLYPDPQYVEIVSSGLSRISNKEGARIRLIELSPHRWRPVFSSITVLKCSRKKRDSRGDHKTRLFVIIIVMYSDLFAHYRTILPEIGPKINKSLYIIYLM
ncbi:MAG: hypothetical protein PVH61_09720 [Candidatus Aminicenantes bacterium]|jgi:hypothetical protein